MCVCAGDSGRTVVYVVNSLVSTLPVSSESVCREGGGESGGGGGQWGGWRWSTGLVISLLFFSAPESAGGKWGRAVALGE